jgi:preprotein translocase subunit SecG
VKQMGILRIILTVIFVLVCIVSVVLVLLQEGKSAGLGAIAGAAESYWGKNKGRSMEGILRDGRRSLSLYSSCLQLF